MQRPLPFALMGARKAKGQSDRSLGEINFEIWQRFRRLGLKSKQGNKGGNKLSLLSQQPKLAWHWGMILNADMGSFDNKQEAATEQKNPTHIGKFKVSIYTEDFGGGGVDKHINLEVSHPVTSQSRDGKIGIGKRIPKQFDKTTTKWPGKSWQRVSKI